MEETFDEHAKKRRACARSKAWRSQEIGSGPVVKTDGNFREAKQTLRRAIRRAKKGFWNKFVQRANKDV